MEDITINLEYKNVKIVFNEFLTKKELLKNAFLLFEEYETYKSLYIETRDKKNLYMKKSDLLNELYLNENHINILNELPF